ncbi:MAG: CPBP family intramembrane metalloprotease [Anaerolineaceae bacterium]|nr:CPBP family intramembrane metalloprotease [Anaerolineaceae bacterium]
MTENIARKTFSRIGFAQVAGIAATILIGQFALAPLATAENMQKIIDMLGPSALLLLIYVPQIAYLLLYWLVVRTMPKMEWQKETLSFGTLVKIFLMMYAVSSVINQIGTAITKTAPAGGDFQLDLIAKMESTRLPMAIAIPVVIGPILEELIFRKLMLDRTRAYGEKTAIIFSAICFGLFHGNLTQFLYAGCVGLFLGYVYCKTGKVLYTMIMHILLNGTSSIILLLVPMLEQQDQNSVAIGGISLLLIFLILGIMTVMGFILLFRWIKQKKFVFDESMPDFIPQNEVLKTVYLNPGVILLFVIEIATIITTLFNISLPWE